MLAEGGLVGFRFSDHSLIGAKLVIDHLPDHFIAVRHFSIPSLSCGVLMRAMNMLIISTFLVRCCCCQVRQQKVDE
jgi:hypothetical protein